ncbi:01P13-2 [Rhynchospora pubera]|uniref:01P13-2 n=1 Tax=Rhynchospora pubera TaxID=906938 RepID=A0AAV8ERZ3_9POAL|nr:01P13-2 [Rhynchospora pubera]
MSLESNKLTSELLNERNYLSWAKSVTFTLSGKGKLGHVTGTKTKPTPAKPSEPTDEDNRKIEEWQMADHCVMSWILASIEPRLSKMFLYTKTARELWQKIEGVYGQRNNYCYIYQLKQKIYHATKGTKNHTEYLVELTAKFDELEEYLPPTSDPQEIERRQEHEKVYLYLGGLDSSYDVVRSQILLSPELPSFSAVVVMVQREDSRRTAMNKESQEQCHAVENQAFAATISNTNSDRGRNKGNRDEKCAHCKKNGHPIDRCWVLHPHLKPKWRGDGGNRGQGEAAKKTGKNLDTERKGFCVRGEEDGEVIESTKVARAEPTEPSRLDRIESQISQLALILGHKLGQTGPSHQREDW